MIEYLIIQLDDTSASYCHYDTKRTDKNLIPLETLKIGIRFSMTENLMVQFVFPNYELSKEYKDIIESIDHNKIVPSLCEDNEVKEKADIIVFQDWTGISCSNLNAEKCYVLRTKKVDLFDRYSFLKDLLTKTKRIKLVITDIESFTVNDFKKYEQILFALSEHIESLYIEGKSPQLNILTDRMMLSEMNNCGAGVSNITLAPNGKFYICPAFYYEKEANYIGDLEHGLDIKNQQLYKLDHSPICKHCDAWQCNRCVWLNKKTTLEVNIPSHEQCVISHLERNASRHLFQNIRKHGAFLPEKEEIKEISYLDPFDVREQW